ncbi:amidohydrolase [Rossellomorea vietnamensis]|uniref:Amidohydrolase n=1 Tax=Rossellomorea vietnamensis TaxID=218284 RepID=A0A5D4KJB2_9BACI|nr:amidohydrolase [Rossellomorea vietnamensis]TYR76969.1 amidohydrolase [Rossellomorea vietnamensis]
MGTLWFNGKFYTMTEEGSSVEAVFTKNGYITRTGSVQELEAKYADLISDRVDLQGNTVYPGFVDSHMHLIGHGETLIRLDLSKMNTKEQVLQAIKEKAAATPEGNWVIGEGFNENLWEDSEVVTRQEIDEVVPDQPVLLKRICRHAMVANSRALEMAGIDLDTQNPPGGLIEKNEIGELNGVLKDTAQDLLVDAMPSPTGEYLEGAMTKAIENCWKLGLVGGHTEDLSYYGNFEKTYQTFLNVIEKNGKKFRSHLLVHQAVIEDWNDAGNTFMGGTSLVEFGAMKIFADGALGGRTALLSHPYNDDPSTNGVAIHTQEKLTELVKKAREFRLPIAVHTIGDQAFENVLDVVEAYPTFNGRRDRFIHAQLLRRELIDRIKKLPLILDIQPRFVPSDFPWVIDRVGEENMEYNYAWKTLLDEGIPCAGGSDAPIEPVDPLLGMHAAVTRTNPLDPQKTVYMEDQRLSMYEAVSLFTKGSAYACHHEHDHGMIKEGYRADFTVLPKDLFKIDPDELLGMEVEMTIVDETVVYKNA